ALSLALACLATEPHQPAGTDSHTGLRPRWTRWPTPGNVLAALDSPIYGVAALPGPDGRTLLATGSADGTGRLWDPPTGQPGVPPLPGHADVVWAVVAVPVPGPGGGGLRATGSFDGTVRLWPPLTGQPVGEALTGHTRGVNAVAAVPGPDGRTLLATGSADGTV